MCFCIVIIHYSMLYRERKHMITFPKIVKLEMNKLMVSRKECVKCLAPNQERHLGITRYVWSVAPVSDWLRYIYNKYWNFLLYDWRDNSRVMYLILFFIGLLEIWWFISWMVWQTQMLINCRSLRAAESTMLCHQLLSIRPLPITLHSGSVMPNILSPVS